jgi:hypothetical protein
LTTIVSAHAAISLRWRASQNRIAKAVDVANHIHAFQHGLPVVLHQNRNNTFTDEAEHRDGIIFENDCLL